MNFPCYLELAELVIIYCDMFYGAGFITVIARLYRRNVAPIVRQAVRVILQQ